MRIESSSQNLEADRQLDKAILRGPDERAIEFRTGISRVCHSGIQMTLN